MKEDFDYCEAPSECKSGRCTNGRCTSNEIAVQSQLSLNLMLILVFLMLIIVITTCYYAKLKIDHASGYSRSDRHSRRDSSSVRRHRDRSGNGSHASSRSSSSSAERHRGGASGRSGSGFRDGPSVASLTDSSVKKRERSGRKTLSAADTKKTERLSKESLEKLNNQNEVFGSEKREPALLFIDDDQEENKC